MYIYVLRHGETDANVSGVFQGQADGQLLKSGYDLAYDTGVALRDLVRFDAAFSSPLSRAYLTARTVLDAMGQNNLELQIDERLLEINMGQYEGKRFRPGEREVDASMCQKFFDNAFTFPGFPNGETTHDVCERTQAFLMELVTHEFNNVLVSTHGFALRAMLNPFYLNHNDFWQGHVPYNCSISILEAVDGTMKLIRSDAIFYDEKLCVDRYESY